MTVGRNVAKSRRFGRASGRDVGLPHMCVDWIMNALFARLSVRHAADAPSLTGSVQKNLNRCMMSERWLVNHVDENRPCPFPIRLDAPSFAVRPTTTPWRAFDANQMYDIG
jgi:hypothetical protein